MTAARDVPLEERHETARALRRLADDIERGVGQLDIASWNLMRGWKRVSYREAKQGEDELVLVLRPPPNRA